MAKEKINYIPLLTLPVEWGTAAGMPKEMVLRRLCEWAVVGAFPRGAFVTSTGDQIDPFDIYMSFRAGATDEKTVTLGDRTMFGRRPEILMNVLVAVEDVLVFCEKTKTIPPPFLHSRFSRFLAQLHGGKHLAPPPCPNAENHATRIDARNSAIGWMNRLRDILAGLQGKPRSGFGPRRQDNEPIDFTYWGGKWAETRAYAQNNIERSGEGELQQTLNTLDAEWTAFVSAELSTAGRAAPIEDTDQRTRKAETTKAISQNRALSGPRLSIAKRARLGVFDGHSLKLSRRSFDLLLMLAQGGGNASAPVLKRDIEKQLFSAHSGEKAVSQALHRLKRELKKSGVGHPTVDSLIENIRATGYRLTIARSEIKVDE
jgi:DNA-binding winged helix-turn-helix (wHTH) protein